MRFRDIYPTINWNALLEKYLHYVYILQNVHTYEI